MNSLGEVISVVSTGRTKLLIPTDTTDISRKYENDHLYEMMPELVNDRFRGWYCKRFYEIGRKRVLELAAIAKSDSRKDARKLFSYLLKQETA